METKSERFALILTPYDKEFEPVIEAVKECVGQEDFVAYTSAERTSGGNLVEAIVTNIFHAELIICDLTNTKANVLYELGVAHALSKSCIVICEKRDNKWVVRGSVPGDGGLPFDLASYEVIEYTNDAEGLKTLKAKIRARLKQSGGRRLPGPVNDALESILGTRRTLNYMLHGAWLGCLVGLAASLPTALLGRSFVWEWHHYGRFMRTVLETGVGGLFLGGLCFTSFALLYNHYERSRNKIWTRMPFVIVAAIAGLVAGTVGLSMYVILDVMQYDVATALSISVPHVLFMVLFGIGFGWSASIEPPLRRPDPLPAQLRRATLIGLMLFGAFAASAHLLRHRLFPEAYLAKYQSLDPFSDSARYFLMLIGAAGTHWWLRWGKRL